MVKNACRSLLPFIGAAGALLVIFAATPFQLIAFGSILGAGLGIFLATNWALANQMAPQGDAGKYMGLTNLATAGSPRWRAWKAP